MSLIESLDPSAFTAYLKKYRNTICGRHPISVLLNVCVMPFWNCLHFILTLDILKAVQHLRLTTSNGQPGISGTLRFLYYAQSSQCLRMRDSSVSYASATLNLSNWFILWIRKLLCIVLKHLFATLYQSFTIFRVIFQKNYSFYEQIHYS